MVRYKEQYKDKLVGVNDYGTIDTRKVSAEVVKKLSVTYKNLIKLIEPKPTNNKIPAPGQCIILNVVAITVIVRQIMPNI